MHTYNPTEQIGAPHLKRQDNFKLLHELIPLLFLHQHDLARHALIGAAEQGTIGDQPGGWHAVHRAAMSALERDRCEPADEPL